MKSRRNLRPAATAAGPMMILVLAIQIGCRDSVRAEKQPARVVGLTSDHDALRRIHADNTMEWIGRAHNASLDEFRARLSRMKKPPRSLCGFIASFAAEPERFPVEQRSLVSGSGREVIRATLATSKMCAPKSTPKLKHSSNVTAMPLASEEAYELLGEAEDAIDAAESPSDLAARLQPILNASAGLPPTEGIAMQAAISVAQNSFEFWPGAYRPLTEEIADHYDSCASDYPVTYGGDAVRDACFESGGTYDVRGASPRVARNGSLTLVAWHPSACSSDPGPALKAIGKADLRGAFAGALTGAFTGGPPGAVTGALLGAMAGSVTTGIEESWDAFWCIYKH
jgi:hypothetical protein